jgi:N-acetylglucosaminyl-diphospho-decaprenol L-rhamnosyltransferase
MDGVRAVVLTHGTGGEYGPLLESLQREGMALDQVVVVHNPTAPGEAPPPVPDGCELLSAGRNIGYTGGMNLGIEHQLDRDGDLLLILTHDARFRENGLRALVTAARESPSYGVLGPALVHSGTDTPFSFGGLTHANGERTHIRRPPETEGGIAPCDWVDGGTMLFRTDLLRQIGGFDARFFIYCEDAEICWRASQAGFGVGVVPAALADQAPGGAKRLGPWAYLMTRNGAAYTYRAKGWRGLAPMIGSSLRIVGLNLLRVIARGLRLRKGSPAEPWALSVGTAGGLTALALRRWGPPPKNLPGSGDVKNAG